MPSVSLWKDLPVRPQGIPTLNRIQENRLSCALVHKNAELLQICFWKLLILLPFCWCWRNELLVPLLTSFSGTCNSSMGSEWAKHKGVCKPVPKPTTVYSLLLQDWNRLWKNEAIQKPRRASAFSCRELVSRLPLWITSNVIFCFYQSASTWETSTPGLIPDRDLEIITAMLWLHPGHNFKVLGISYLFKLKKLPGFDSRHLVNLFLWFLLDEKDKLFCQSSKEESTCLHVLDPLHSHASCLPLKPAQLPWHTHHTLTQTHTYFYMYHILKTRWKVTEIWGIHLYKTQERRDICVGVCQYSY